MKNEIELITKALKDAYKFVKEQEQNKETSELLINLFKAEILLKNCSTPVVVGQSELLKAFVDRCNDKNSIACSPVIHDGFINEFLKSL